MAPTPLKLGMAVRTSLPALMRAADVVRPFSGAVAVPTNETLAVAPAVPGASEAAPLPAEAVPAAPSAPACRTPAVNPAA